MWCVYDCILVASEPSPPPRLSVATGTGPIYSAEAIRAGISRRAKLKVGSTPILAAAGISGVAVARHRFDTVFCVNLINIQYENTIKPATLDSGKGIAALRKQC